MPARQRSRCRSRSRAAFPGNASRSRKNRMWTLAAPTAVKLPAGATIVLKDGTHIRIQPVITESKMSVGGMRVDKNSALRKGLKGATVGLATERGGYIDTVTETVKKILNGEEVEDYVAPEVPAETKDWMTTFLLCLFLGGLGVHRYYVGKIGTGILYTLTAGLFGIGYLVDFIKILCGKFTDKDGNLIQREKK